MAGRKKGRLRLDGPNPAQLQEIGKNLRLWREEHKWKTAEVAALGGTDDNVVQTIEAGRGIPMGCGAFRHLVRKGYRTTIRRIALPPNAGELDEKTFPKKRYRIIHPSLNSGEDQATKFLTGGVPGEYTWSIPLVHLEGTMLLPELHQIEPGKKRPCFQGEALIYPLVGTIEITPTKTASDGTRLSLPLKGNWALHYKVDEPHLVKATDDSEAVFLLVRIQKPDPQEVSPAPAPSAARSTQG